MKTKGQYFDSLAKEALGGSIAERRKLFFASEIWLLRHFERRVPSHHVNDLVQETLASLHAHLESFDTRRPFLPWLVTIAHHRWVDLLRKQSRLREVPLEEMAGLTDEAEWVVASLSFENLIRRIKPEQALVIKLVRIEGLSIAEASQLSGQSESLVKVNIHRGIRKMAAIAQDEAAISEQRSDNETKQGGAKK